MAVISPLGVPSSFDMDLHSVGVAVATNAPNAIVSGEEFGEPTLFTLTNPPPPAASASTKLCSPLDLLRGEGFPEAGSPAQILPEVYGDFTLGGLRGPIPTVLVTQTTPWVFVGAAHGVKSIDKVYVGDVEQTSGFVTIPVADLGSGLQVAAISFDVQPMGDVTWRGKGKMNAAGVLIEDPVLQLEDVLLTRGGYTAADFDATALAEAKAASAASGWTTAFVFNDARQVQDWITEVLFNVMGYWRVSGDGRLQIILDPGGAPDQSALVASVVAARDCIDGDDGVAFVLDREQVVNKLIGNYQYSWQEQLYTSQVADETLEHAVSKNAYGELRKEVTLRGHRTAAQVAAWAAILFERQALAGRVEGAVLQFSVRGPRLVHATVGDLVAFSWPYGPTREDGNPYVNEILRIIQVSHDFSLGGVTHVIGVDTGTYVTSGGTRLLTPLSI